MSGGYDQSSFSDLVELDPLSMFNILHEHLSEMDVEEEEIKALADVIFNMADHQAKAYKSNDSTITPSLDVVIFRYVAIDSIVDNVSNIPELLKILEGKILGRNTKQHVRIVEIMANVKQLAKNTMAARIQEAAKGYLNYTGDLSNSKEYLSALGFDDTSVAVLASASYLRNFMVILYLFYILATLKLIVLQNSQKAFAPIEQTQGNLQVDTITMPTRSKVDPVSKSTSNEETWRLALEHQDRKIAEMQHQQTLMLTKIMEHMKISDNASVVNKPTMVPNNKRNNVTAPLSTMSNKNNTNHLPPASYPSATYPSSPLDEEDDDEDYSEETLQQGVNQQSLSRIIKQLQSPGQQPGKAQYSSSTINDNQLPYSLNLAESYDSNVNSNLANLSNSPTTEEVARSSLLNKLKAMYAIGRNPSIDEHLATQAAYGSVMLDIRGLLVHYAPTLTKLGYSTHQKIFSTLLLPGNDTSLLGMPDRWITRHGPIVTVEQSIAFLNEQIEKSFSTDTKYPCIFEPIGAMEHIISFRDRVMTLFDSALGGTSKPIIQDNPFHVTTFAALRMFLITTWNRAMLHRDLSLLLKDFDTIWSQHYEKYLMKTVKGHATIPLNEALTLLYYYCQNCGKLGTVLEICTNPKCSSTSSKVNSSTTPKDNKSTKSQFTPAYTAAIKVWRSTFASDAPRASKSDSVFRTTSQFKALSAADKISPTKVSTTPTPTNVKSNIHTDQSCIELHVCPIFRN